MKYKYERRGGANNYPKHRVAKAIIGLLEMEGAMTPAQMAPRVSVGTARIKNVLRRLKLGEIDGLPKVRISGWTEPDQGGCGPSEPLWAIGSKKDALYVARGRNEPSARAAARARKAERLYGTRNAILLTIAARGPMTIRELSEEVDRAESQVTRWVRKLQEGVVPLARLRVSSFDNSRPGLPSPRYNIGNGHEAKYRHMSRAERRKRYMERYGAVVKLRETKRKASPFDQLLALAS